MKMLNLREKCSNLSLIVFILEKSVGISCVIFITK